MTNIHIPGAAKGVLAGCGPDRPLSSLKTGPLLYFSGSSSQTQCQAHGSVGAHGPEFSPGFTPCRPCDHRQMTQPLLNSFPSMGRDGGERCFLEMLLPKLSLDRGGGSGAPWRASEVGCIASCS